MAWVIVLASAAAAPPDAPSTPAPATPAASSLDSNPAPGASAAAPTAGNLGLPTGLREGGGGEPTTAASGEAAGTSTPAHDYTGPGWLNKLLGIEDAPVNAYGWIQNSFNYNANGRGSGQNFALFPDHLADQWMGNQYYLVVENQVDRTDKINLGFRVDTLLGNDWTYTHSLGFLDGAFRPNSFAGIDFPQIYGEIHLPWLTKGGIDIKGGRFYSIAGYEAVMATRRPLLSWPYILTYTPFTFFGFLSTLHLTDRVNLFNGATTGWDRWIDKSYKWNYLGGIGWTSRDQKAGFTGVLAIGPNQLPSFLGSRGRFVTAAPTGVTPLPFETGRRNILYGGSDRAYFSLVGTYQWSDRLTEALETDLIFEKNVPNLGPGGTPNDAEWYGLGHWFLYKLMPKEEKLTGVWRSEVFRDNNGGPTGVAATYFEMTLGLIYKPKPWLWVRPEARYDWTQSQHPFSDGTRSSRLTLGFDVIVLF